MTASLHDLAAQKRLPAHQIMDQDTLAWIAGNRPPWDAASARLPHQPLLLVPKTAWFADARCADSIHGISHNARVCLLASLLAQQHHLEPDQTAALCLAAAVHDCRRRDDRADPGHGQRAAVWLSRRHQAVATAFDLHLTPELIAAACTAISLHNLAYPAFSPAQQQAYQRAAALADLLKAADCLDRYRLPLPRWWPDVSRLRVAVPTWLHQVAFDLMLRSEQARLDGASHHDALTHARQTALT